MSRSPPRAAIEVLTAPNERTRVAHDVPRHGAHVSTLAEQLLSPFHQGEQRTLSHHALRTCVAVGEGASTTSAQGYALNRVSHFMDAGDKTYESASVPIDRSVAAVTEDLPEEERELLELLEELVREPTPGRARSCRRRGSCTAHRDRSVQPRRHCRCRGR